MKGFGYIIEGFAATLVVLLFLGGAFLSQQGTTQEWSDYRTEVTASDISLAAEMSGEKGKLVDSGELNSLPSLYAAYSEDEVGAEIVGGSFPRGSSSVGVYVPAGGRLSVDLTGVGAGDRCEGELDEIRSEEPVLRTVDDPGSPERYHGARVYVADQDPQSGSGFNGEEDYDTVYVDNGSTCVFSAAEGPYYLDEIFHWSDRTNDQNSSYYEVKYLEGSSQMEVYRAELAGELRERTRRADFRSSGVVYDTFNMSEDLSYDLLVFHGNQTLDTLDANQLKMMRYLQSGRMVLAAQLQPSDMGRDFLSRTGLKWVDLPVTTDSGAVFTSGPDSVEMENYFDSVGCYSCGSLELDPQAKVSSSTRGYISSGNQRLVSTNSYDTSPWDVSKDSLPSDSSAPAGVPVSDCSPPHWRGNFQFPEGTSTENLEVYVTHLGQGDGGCSGDYAVNVDQDDDGDYTGEGERAVLEGRTLVINERNYTVAGSSGAASFSYSGGRILEQVNYRDTFEDMDVEGFARTGNLTDNGKLGGKDGEELVMASALVLHMLEPADSDDFSQDVSSTDTGISSGVPYEFGVRWSR